VLAPHGPRTIRQPYGIPTHGVHVSFDLLLREARALEREPSSWKSGVTGPISTVPTMILPTAISEVTDIKTISVRIGHARIGTTPRYMSMDMDRMRAATLALGMNPARKDASS
jgi:hypothetical protein